MAKLSQHQRVAEYVGVSVQVLKENLRSPETCPLCIEVGGEKHGYRRCLNVLDVMQDQYYGSFG